VGFYFRQLYKWFQRDILAIPGRTLGLAFFVPLFLLPVITTDPFILGILIMTAIYAIFAISWDFLAGFTGQLSLGHALFFGVAGYTSALLNSNLGLPVQATIPIGCITAMLAGLVVAIPALRLRGFYLALCTLVFPIILSGVVHAFPEITGGEFGIAGIDSLGSNRVVIYYLVNMIMLVSALIMWKLTDSTSKVVRTGIILRAICEDEITARASGINTTFYKFVAFAISGLVAGLAGGLYVHFIKLCGPSTLDMFLSFQVILWTVFGGMGTIYGPIVGVFILHPLTNFLSLHEIGAQVKYVAFAVLLIVTLLFMPQGIAKWTRDHIEERCPRCMTNNSVTRRFCRACRAPMRFERV